MDTFGPPAATGSAEKHPVRDADRLVDNLIATETGIERQLYQAAVAVLLQRDVDDIVEVPLVIDRDFHHFAQIRQVREEHADRPEIGELAPSCRQEPKILAARQRGRNFEQFGHGDRRNAVFRIAQRFLRDADPAQQDRPVEPDRSRDVFIAQERDSPNLPHPGPLREPAMPAIACGK
jgi:hypothetical protein